MTWNIFLLRLGVTLNDVEQLFSACSDDSLLLIFYLTVCLKPIQYVNNLDIIGAMFCPALAGWLIVFRIREVQLPLNFYSYFLLATLLNDHIPILLVWRTYLFDPVCTGVPVPITKESSLSGPTRERRSGPCSFPPLKYHVELAFCTYVVSSAARKTRRCAGPCSISQQLATEH
jgi:hypothetical protein